MKKFLFWLSAIVAFFVMLSNIVPIISAWWQEHKLKKEVFDQENDPEKVKNPEVVDLHQNSEGTFESKGGKF